MRFLLTTLNPLDYVQVWFSVAAAPLETRIYTPEHWLLREAEAAALPDCSQAFRACFAASAGAFLFLRFGLQGYLAHEKRPAPYYLGIGLL